MKQIRQNVFETNSSSTHSLIIATDEEYQKLKNGELFIDQWKECIVEPDETNEDLVSLDEWGDEYEHFYEEYKTKHGDHLHVFGYYGHD